MDEQKLYYDTFFGKYILGSKAREKKVDAILKKIKKGDTFLEVGCSNGYYLKKIANKCKRSVGVDISQEKLDQAKKRNKKSEFVRIEDTKLPFKDNEFDWVLCTEVLEHIPKYKEMVKEINRVAKKNILITIPIEDGYYWNLASLIGFGLESRGHVHKLRSKDIEKHMNNFKLVHKEFIATPLRLLNRFFNKPKESHSLYAILFFQHN